MTDLLEIPDFLIRTAGGTKLKRRFSDEALASRRAKSIARDCVALLEKHRKRKAREQRRRQNAARP